MLKVTGMPFWRSYSYTIAEQISEYFIRLRGYPAVGSKVLTRYVIFLNDIAISPDKCVSSGT